ncbi:MAG: hypothetical protein EA398_17750 [Deltaproteobacteria bacterium]|nr:MAG: hypothetical protein EA398_17750 [Deltaproteobacteria bacterium]
MQAVGDPSGADDEDRFADVVDEVSSWDILPLDQELDAPPDAQWMRAKGVDLDPGHPQASVTTQTRQEASTPSSMPVVHALVDRIEALLNTIEGDSGTGELVMMDEDGAERLRLPVRNGALLPGARFPDRPCLDPLLLNDPDARNALRSEAMRAGVADTSDPADMQHVSMTPEVRSLIETLTVGALLRTAATMEDFPANIRFVPRPELDAVLCRIIPLQVRMACVREVIGRPPRKLLGCMDVLRHEDRPPSLLWSDGVRVLTTATPRDPELRITGQRRLEDSLQPLVTRLRSLRALQAHRAVWLGSDGAWCANVHGNWVLLAAFERSQLGRVLALMADTDA